MRDREDRFAGSAALVRAVVSRRWMDAGTGMPWSARRARAAALLAAAPLVIAAMLSACSSDDDAIPPPEVTLTSTPTPTQQPTASPTVEEHTPEADPTEELEAEITKFFEEYIDAVNQSWTSEEALQRRREMFADSCQECLAGYQFAELKHSDELVVEADDVVVRDVALVSSNRQLVVFTTVIDSPRALLLAPDGEVVQEFDEYIGVQSSYQAVTNEAGDWVIIKGEIL